MLAGSNGCTVVGGRLVDPYSGERIKITARNLDTIDIDHVFRKGDTSSRQERWWGRRCHANDHSPDRFRRAFCSETRQGPISSVAHAVLNER